MARLFYVDPITKRFTSPNTPRAEVHDSAGYVYTGSDRRKVIEPAKRRATERKRVATNKRRRDKRAESKREAAREAQKVRDRRQAEAEERQEKIMEEAEGMIVGKVAPANFPPGYDSPFREFITPVRFMSARGRRLAYVMCELADTAYKTQTGGNLIIPVRLGQFTKKQLTTMTGEELIEEASSAFDQQWSQVIAVHGVYVRKE